MSRSETSRGTVSTCGIPPYDAPGRTGAIGINRFILLPPPSKPMVIWFSDRAAESTLPHSSPFCVVVRAVSSSFLASKSLYGPRGRLPAPTRQERSLPKATDGLPVRAEGLIGQHADQSV